MTRFFKLMQAGAIGACLLISGCGGTQFNYQPDHDLKPGPGLFSGKTGEFQIIGKPASEKTEEEPVQPAGE